MISPDAADKVTKDDLLQLEELRANPFAARICDLFSEDMTGVLTFEKFLNMLSAFSTHTLPEIKMIWAFAIWDFDGDDLIGEGC